MPTAKEILDALTLIANEGKSVAFAWHVLMFVAVVALALSWRPSERIASTLAVLPIASAVAAAVVFRNPFNVVLLGLAALALLALALRGEPKRVTPRPRLDDGRRCGNHRVRVDLPALPDE
jgi:hypothetical protein